MKSTSLTRLWIWFPGFLLVFAVGVGLAAGAAHPSAWAASGASTPATGSATTDGDEVQEQIINGECELVDANGVPLYDSQFEQRTDSSPCDQH